VGFETPEQQQKEQQQQQQQQCQAGAAVPRACGSAQHLQAALQVDMLLVLLPARKQHHSLSCSIAQHTLNHWTTGS
jgi:hypothetical protein